MEPVRFGRHRVHDLETEELVQSGLPRAVAARFAARAQLTGHHPPLDESEAERLGGKEQGVTFASLYAESMGLREATIYQCNVCGSELEEPGTPCPSCGELDVLTLRSWTPSSIGRLRQPAWLIFVHGMNTRGDWQQELAWKLSLAAPRPTPVMVHKYGRVLWVLGRRGLRKRAQRLATELHRLSDDAEGSSLASTGDVLAHSLGTWLLAHALRIDETLRVGRVMLTGSIVAPTFEWEQLIAQGRVEAVCNLRALRDWEVAISERLIPDSGPGGRLGFRDGVVVDHVEPTWAHSTCFKSGQGPASPMNVTLDAFWRPFLTWNSSALCKLGDSRTPRRTWSPSRFSRARKPLR